MTSFSAGGEVDTLASKGFESDGWCEPAAWLRLRARADLVAGSCRIWIQKEDGAPHVARFAVQVDQDEPFVCEIETGRVTTLVFASRRTAGRPFNLSFLCNRRLWNKGEDVRDLSFLLEDLKLHAS